MAEKGMIIVGAGPGISLGAAKKFGRNGYKIALIARRKEALLQYENELKSEGIAAKGFEGDASSEESLKAAIQAAIRELGRVDVLLYNAAAGKPGKPTSLTAENLMNDFKISVAGALTSVKEALPHLDGGAVLLTGGGLAIHPAADLASLSIGKAGIRSLSHTLHQELKEQGIYVGTLIVKGFVQEDTYYSPDHIGEAFYKMAEDRNTHELIFEEK
ncbi:SDR family NAD(P)-dependent oxidoreductase [Metabacillus sp. GX 13764]|uniref:SDR family NAD(P)-dependent oxidoreductase n=1 Tax=Metabacillus kandeliae TaxID=2900151 RepID=UPI001E500105|nr:SDR family NAD(P)-dependent oxidoreductase [Metabacillus kandeliae]MCD7035406.1 SDR family NAD(P)-dependent oxidoreductase [Metabacillus kandeliae]